MTTINLYQSPEMSEKEMSLKKVNSGLIFSVLIILASVVLVGLLKLSVSYLNQKNDAVKEEVKNEEKNLVGVGKLELVVDMQGRLESIKNNLQIKNDEVQKADMVKILDNFQTDLNTSSLVTSYKYNEGKIIASFNANNFNDIARQIQNFKKSSSFTNVSILNIKRVDSGISCEVEMGLKNKI